MQIIILCNKIPYTILQIIYSWQGNHFQFQMKDISLVIDTKYASKKIHLQQLNLN